MLAHEDYLPEAIVYHCGRYLIGNKKFNLKKIRKLIVKEMNEAAEVVQTCERVKRECSDVHVIWSRIVSRPFQSKQFSQTTLLNAVKTVNSEASVDLYAEHFGILKHTAIEAGPKWFNPEGSATPVARMQFLHDFDTYLREKDRQEGLQKAFPHVRPMIKKVEFSDNLLRAKIADGQKKEEEIDR